ncbi:MAG: hypothetical protein B7X86_06310 [Sphingobacteriales bacterium 17-39-43]|nr:MAG: hypothetical protein B7Y76_03510 [Sphingobacteriia bacterium 35-40-5]OYZ31611.1 MAG: hypothetical protein B7Y24_07125 [Sphingobacteriales bacterium 16-39-50]OYZ58569.1 MAG: hypothetical protein B7Y19_01880 [Sphingobacteriales bacterium 24-40-4]OZA25006.1 MAG: hypothetical protein B7X86_06310 [Sphingobacteriales bacterium 17-39-43]OZA58052.1 MAG: hypothetical protein B7X75_05145 [Sphingobacteriales bacterium 39-40-5]
MYWKFSHTTPGSKKETFSAKGGISTPFSCFIYLIQQKLIKFIGTKKPSCENILPPPFALSFRSKYIRTK